MTGFQQFEPLSDSDLIAITYHLKISNLSHDILPSHFLMEALTTIGPCIQLLLKLSLSLGCVPSVFKHSVFHPIIKKNNLDPSSLTNYRLISKLPPISKILEKASIKQLQTFPDTNGINEKFQSKFRPRHSTKTAHLRVFIDLLLSLGFKLVGYFVASYAVYPYCCLMLLL